MESNPQQERQQAHAYLDYLPDAQVSAVRGLLEAMLDPVSRAVAEAREWLKHSPGIPFEEVFSG